MTGVLERLDIEIEKQSLLKHPFYRMWSEGRLTSNHLQGYAREYFHIVRKVPDFVRNIYCRTSDSSLERELAQNIKEESDHIDAWKSFALSLGVSKDELLNYAPTYKTTEAVRTLDSLTRMSFGEAAAAMYGYEKQLPKISRSKIDGLKKYYGIDKGEATRYFEIHEEADIRHAGLWMNILKNVSPDMSQSVFEAGFRSLGAQNKLLDSIQEKYIGQYC
jgi:pyrroloquinoline-quinone synthase